MGKRNQVTADLRISAEAQLTNSRNFINQLQKIVDQFDFGDKMTKQLLDAQEQLKNYNKVLEKVQNKSIISDNELKDLVKAGEAVASVIAKTEKLYSGLNTSQWQKFSKEYIAQVKAQEKEVLKIKEEYQKKTGKIYDKEIANYDKILAKNKELKAQREQLAKTGIDDLANKQIEQLNQKLDKQKTKLEEIIALREKSSKAFSTAANKVAQDNGYSSYAAIKGTRVLSDTQVQRQLGTEKYNQEKQSLSEMLRLIKEIEQNESDINVQNEQAVAIAKRYNIENIKDLTTLKEQYRIRKDILKTFSNDKSRLALQYENELNARLREQLKLRETITAAENAGLAAQNRIINQGGYASKQSLSASFSATNKSVANLQNQLTETGIENIVNNATNTVNALLRQIDADIKQSNGELGNLDETNKKLAVQSERTADEQDIANMNKQFNNELNSTEGDVNKHTSVDNDRIANNIIRLGVSGQIPYGAEIKTMARNWADTDDETYDQLDINLDEYDRLSSKLESEINELKIGAGNVEAVKKAAKEFEEVYDSIIEITIANFERAQKDLDDAKKKGEITPESYEEDLTRLTNEKSRFSRYIAVGSNRLDTLDKALSPKTKVNAEVYAEVAEKAANTSRAIGQAAEQSQYLGNTFDDIKNKVGYFLSLNYVFDQMTRKISEAVATTREMDKDMTQIGLVLGKTSTQVWKSFDTYSKMAERLNTTTSEVTQSMKLFYQQGLNTTEVNKMVEASAIAAALGESTMAEASETLTSILNSYNLTASEAMTVTDKISQIAIVSAADFGELSTAIEKVASSAASAGLDLDHMMGYLAKMIETTREAPTNIGTALKTIVANFTQFKEDPSGLMQEGSEINKVDKALKSVGIRLADTNGEVRDLSEVLDELGGIWDTLNRNQKSYLATAIAGTRQQSRFYALMNDYERTLELVEEGTNSAGKAQQQFALYSNSLEAASNRLTNQWEKFFNSITQGNGLIATLTNTLTGLMKIVNAIGPIGSALGLTSLISSARKGINYFANLNNKIKEIKNLDIEYQNTRNTIDNTTGLSGAEKQQLRKKARENYNNNLINNQTALEKLGPEAVNYKKRMDEIVESHDEWIKKINESDKPLKNLRKKGVGALTGIKKAGAGVPVVFKQIKQAIGSLMTQFAVLLALQLILKTISFAYEQLHDVLGVNTEAFVENAEKAQENADNVNNLKSEYEQLATKVNRTAEEEARLKEITEEVVAIDKELGQQLKDNGKNYEANVKLMQEYVDLQEKIAAQNTASAIKSETGIGHAILHPFKTIGNAWKDAFGSENTKQSMISAEQNDWRNLASARGTEHSLNSTQTSMLDKYVDNLIRSSENRNWTSGQYNENTDEFDEMILDFINSLKQMTEAQQTAYENYLDLAADTENTTWLEMAESLMDLDVPDTVKEELSRQVMNIFDSVQAQIDANPYISDADKVGSASRLRNYIPLAEIEKLFVDNLDNLSEAEQKQYQKDLADFVADLTLVQNYGEALEKGDEAVKDFVQELDKTEKYSDEFLESLVKITDYSEEMVDSIISSMNKLGDLSISDILQGNASQIDILSEFAKGNLKIGDLDFTNGMVTIKTAKLVEIERASLDNLFKAINAEFESQSSQSKDALLQPLKDAHAGLKEQTDKLKYVEAISNALNPMGPPPETLPFQRDYTFKDTRPAPYTNSHLNIAPQTVPTTGSRIKNIFKSSYEGGYGANLEKTGMAYVLQGGTNEQIKYHLDNATSDSYQANVKNNGTYFADTELRATRSMYSERTVDTGIKDTSGMDYEQKLAYFTKQNQALTESEEKIKNLDKNSQEYYDETYKIYQINNDLQKLLLEDTELYDTLTAQNNDLAGTIANNTAEYDRQSAQMEELSAELETQLDVQRKKLQEVQDYMKQSAQAEAENLAVFDVGNAYQTLVGELDVVKQAYAQIGETALKTSDVINLVAQDPTLIDCLEVQNGALQWNKEALEERGRSAVFAADAYADAKIAELEVVLSVLQAETDNSAEWQASTIEQLSKVMGGSTALTDTEQTNTEAEAANLAISQANWVNWSNVTMEAIRKAGEQYNDFLKAQASGEEQDYSYDKMTITDPVTQGGTEGAKDVVVDQSKLKGIQETLGAMDGNGTDREKAIANIQTQIERIKKVKEVLKTEYNDIGKVLSDGGSGGGGSDKEFEPLVEKLEHFYNYLRQIEELEAKINKIREKRNLIDATQNYYIDDLKEENELLRQQSALYGNYIDDEKEYLAELRSALSSAYSDWVYFTNDGLVQVKQTEFAINSEEEEERYNAFSELLDEYQNEYNTMLENQNTLYSIQSTMVENINSMYDKMLQRLSDVTERLEYINSISEHKVTMNFGSIDKLPLLSDQIKTTADMLLFADDAVKRLEGDFAVLTDLVGGSAFKELLTWDETLQKFIVNNAKMNEKTQAQYEAQGYNWEDIVSWVESVVAASQKVTDSLQESNGQLMDAREALKDLLEERISTIDEIFEKATDEMNKFYGIYETKIESLGTENDLFGVKSENLDKQFEYLTQTATHAKVLLADLKENNQMVLNTLMKDYGQYVDMIDGVAYINKMAIEESDSLTEGQRADLLQLYQLYYDSNDQIEELNDKFYDYISQIEELEEAKRDAIIDLKQQVHDELMRLDQKEIDELSEKYAKMNALDNEYYSKLQQRISDARDARSRLQDQQNLTQMQNRLSVLQQDNSGQYNSELVELQRQINEQLQTQADTNVDLEMERIAREQQQRQEDREMQITQMENLLTFKDENGIYWQETQGMINANRDAIIGFLMESDDVRNTSQEAQQQTLDSLEDLTNTASAALISTEGYITSNFRNELEELVKAPVDQVIGGLSDAALSNATAIGGQIENGTKTFLNTMSALFDYLAILTGKTTDKGYTTGNLDASGVYTMPTKEPPKPVVTTPPPVTNTSSNSGNKTVAVGSRVKAGSGARIFTSSTGNRGGSQYYANDPVYTVLQILGNRALVRHHKLSSGYTGWFNLSDLTAYKKGGYVDYTGPAWVDGTNNSPEAFLNAKQTALFETLRDALVKMPNINSGDGETGDNITIENLTIDVKELADTDSIDKVVKTVKDSIYKDATSGNNMKINRRR